MFNLLWLTALFGAPTFAAFRYGWGSAGVTLLAGYVGAIAFNMIYVRFMSWRGRYVPIDYLRLIPLISMPTIGALACLAIG